MLNNLYGLPVLLWGGKGREGLIGKLLIDRNLVKCNARHLQSACRLLPALCCLEVVILCAAYVIHLIFNSKIIVFSITFPEALTDEIL